MKKTLSFLLVICMVFAMFPTAIAEVAGCTICGQAIDASCPVCDLSYYCTTCNHCSNCGYRAAIPEEYNTVVKYGIAESYLVTIPETANIENNGIGNITVGITNALLASGKQLAVYVTGDSYTGGYWHLSDVNNNYNQLAYSIDKAGTKLGDYDEVLSVYAGEAWNRTVSATLRLELAQTATQAGSYTDMLTFVVEYGNASDKDATLNEHGFYYNQPYQATVPNMGLVELVFYEDHIIGWYANSVAMMITDVEYQEGQATINNAGTSFTIEFDANGKSCSAESDGEPITCTMRSTRQSDPTAGLYVSDPDGLIGAGLYATYDPKGEMLVYEDESLIMSADATLLEFEDGVVTIDGEIAGLVYPDGSKVAPYEDADQGVVFVKVANANDINTTYNMYYNTLYTGTMDGNKVGIVLTPDDVVECYMYIDASTDPDLEALSGILEEDVSNYYCYQELTTENAVLRAQESPMMVECDGVVLAISPATVHSIYWNKKYTIQGSLADATIDAWVKGNPEAFEAYMHIIDELGDDTVHMLYENGILEIVMPDNEPIEIPAVYNVSNHITGIQSEEINITMNASVDGRFVIAEDIFMKVQEHHYIQEIISPGSCTENGETKYTCTDCGDTYTEIIVAQGHVDEDANTYCDVCNTKIVQEYVDFIVTEENRDMIGYTENTSHLKVPATFQGTDGTWYKVTEIGDASFSGAANLNAVTLPKTITKIGMGAFSQTNIQAFAMPDDNNLEYLGDGAFILCQNLQSIDLGNCYQLKTIGSAICGFSAKLSTAVFPSQALIEGNPFLQKEPVQVSLTGTSDMTRLVDGALYSNHDKTLLYYPSDKNSTHLEVLPTTEIISNNAVNDNLYLQSVSLPNGLKEMQDEAFMFCSALQSIKIPDSVTKIGKYVFGYCESLKKIIVSENITEISSWAFEHTAITSIGVLGSGADCELSPNTVSLDSAAFTDCYHLKTVDLSEMTQLTGISPDREAFNITNTFTNCPIETLKLPASVQRIGLGCFEWDEDTMGYEKPVMSVYITDFDAFCMIQNYGYSYDDNLLHNARLFINGVEAEEITVKQVYDSLDNSLFKGCLSLKKVYIAESMTYISRYLFADCTNLTSVVMEVPNGWYRGGELQTVEFVSDDQTMAAQLVNGYQDWERA